MAAMIAALVRDIQRRNLIDLTDGMVLNQLEKPEVYPPFMIDGKPPHPPL